MSEMEGELGWAAGRAAVRVVAPTEAGSRGAPLMQMSVLHLS